MVCRRRPGAHRDVVDEPARLQPPRDLDVLVGLDAVVAQVAAVDADAEDLVVAQPLAHPGEALEEEPHPVVEGAAPAVGAQVVHRRQELSGQVLVRRVELHTVGTRAADVASGEEVAVEQLGDLRLGHGMRELRRDRRSHVRRRPQRALRVERRHPRAAVGELHDRSAVMLVEAVGEPVEGGDDRLVVGVEVVRELRCRRVHRRALDDDRPDAALGPLEVVAVHRVPDDAVVRHQRLVAGEHGAVLQVQPAGVERRGQVWEGHGAHPLTMWVSPPSHCTSIGPAETSRNSTPSGPASSGPYSLYGSIQRRSPGWYQPDPSLNVIEPLVM